MKAIVPRFVRPISLCRRSLVAVATVAAAAAGCLGDNTQPPPQPVDSELAALMEDGKLPDIMGGGIGSVQPPPRFCGGGGPGTGGGFQPPPGGVDGGMGSTGGVTGGGKGEPMGLLGGGSAGFGGGAMPPPSLPADGGMAVEVATGSGGFATDGGSDFRGGTGGFPFDGGGTGGQGGSGADPSCAGVPIGFWRFDDCNTFRTELTDSTFSGHPAFRSVDLTCGPDQKMGQAAQFAAKEDVVYVPDQPDFSLADGVTVAAWIKPDKLGGVRTLFRKRDDGTSAFALVLSDSNLQFVIRLGNGVFASVSASGIKVGKWTHVAGTYDGKVVRVFVNGKDSARIKITGKLSRGAGPLLMGNDISGRRFQGAIDEAWFNTMGAPADTILDLTCMPQPVTAAVAPASSPSVPAGTPVTYQLAISNHNSAGCRPATFDATVNDLPRDFTASPFNVTTTPIASGKTIKVPFSIASGPETEPGTYPIGFFISPNEGFVSVSAQAQYVVAEPAGCHVSSSRELTIRDVSVVDDPIRTSMNGPAGDARVGAWSFGRLMQRLSPSDAAASDVTEDMFRSFLQPQVVNTFPIDPRPAMDPIVLQPWQRTPDGKLDLAQAPMRLLAIVNRLDLKDLAKGKAGEGRLVFGVLGAGGRSLQFTVIFEYFLPASNEAQFKAWADQFHALQALWSPMNPEPYRAALQAITDSFTMRGAMPASPNGSSLIDIRTNEIELSGIWQLREFHLSPTTGFMAPAPVFNTPDSSFNGSEALARFINENEAAVVAETHEVPVTFNGTPFLAGAIFNNGFDVWFAPGINNSLARHKFSLNTCNGCHGAETNTGFLQISPREIGQESFLSGFLTGETVTDRFDGTPRVLNELGRRRQLLQSVVCAGM